MRPPFISCVTWNRMGLSVRNLLKLLESTDDFELHIIDSNSKDDTWDFIRDLKDCRIKSKVRLEKNLGPVYAFNYNLSKRKKDQFHISIDNDVYIHTPDWISRFMEVFNTFSEVGILGVPRSKPYPELIPPVIPRFRDGVCYLRLKNASVNEPLDFIPGCCIAFRPEVFNYIGYWSEESPFTDAEMSARITHYTPYAAGFTTNIRIEQVQFIPCNECPGQKWCSLKGTESDCFKVWAKYYKNPLFVEKHLWKNLKFFEEMNREERSAFCPSVHDPSSMVCIGEDVYHKDWVEENFRFYEENANE